jgi:hypothetical protein
VTTLGELRGLIPDEVGDALYALAQTEVKADEVIVELGSFKGKSTCYLAAGARAGSGAHVYAVDAWDTPGNVTGRHGFAEPGVREAFDAQVAAMGLTDQVTPLQGFTVEVATRFRSITPAKVGLLYVDADHGYESVYRDVRAWEPHLALGAIVAFDDWRTPKNPGVERAVDQLVGEGIVDNVTIVAERLAVGFVL